MVTHFFIGFGLSFIGSLPFGVINMMVAHTAIQKGLRFALWAAAGAVLVEFFQVFISLKFTWLFNENPVIETWLKTIAIAVFIVAGIYFLLFAKSRPPSLDDQTLNLHSRKNEFFKGMLVSSFNVMVIPFWIFYSTLLVANDLLVKENHYVLIFSVGAMLGTFALLICYALFGSNILRKSETITRWVNKIIGAILLGMGLYQLVSLQPTG